MQLYLNPRQNFQVLEAKFKNCLEITGYAKTTMRNLPLHVHDFLDYCSNHGKQSIQDIRNEDLNAFASYLKERPKKKGSGALSQNSIHASLRALKVFCRYLWESKEANLSFQITLEKEEQLKRNILSREEIKRLYKTCTDDKYGTRNKALLSVFYGCGLRRNEAVQLTIDDIHFNKERLYIRQGKGGKERLVPISKQVIKDLENYLYDARPLFSESAQNKTLFLLQGTQMSKNLRALQEKADIKNKISLHGFRHSIATHLLENGMKVDYIRRFLGHSSLESTQIYTHILHKSQKTKDKVQINKNSSVFSVSSVVKRKNLK